MKKVLVVGILPYETMKKMKNKYFDDVMFIDESWIQADDNAKRIVEAVKMVDAVMITSDYHRLPYEVAATMHDKPIESLADYPVDDGGEEA